MTFVAKRAIKFYGFGVMAGYDGIDISYKVKWVIDEVESEEYTKEIKFEGDVDQEKKWFEIRLSDFDCKAPKVPAGGKIDILLGADCEPREYHKRRTFYGYDGEKNDYSTRDD